MRVLTSFAIFLLAASLPTPAHTQNPSANRTAVGETIDMLCPMGDFADGYDPSAVFGALLLTRSFELEVQYSSLGDEFAEEGRMYGYDIPNADMLIGSAGIRIPVSPRASVILGGEVNRAGEEYDIWIEDTFHIMSSRSTEFGVNGGADVALPLGTTTDFLLRLKAHWLPDPEVYFLTLGVGVSLGSSR